MDNPSLFLKLWGIADILPRSDEAIFRTLIAARKTPIFGILLALRPLSRFGPKCGQFLFAIIYRKGPFSATDGLPRFP